MHMATQIDGPSQEDVRRMVPIDFLARSDRDGIHDGLEGDASGGASDSIDICIEFFNMFARLEIIWICWLKCC